MLCEIGSNFWLQPDIEYAGNERFDFKSLIGSFSDAVFLSTGRSAEKMVLDAIEERNNQIQKTALIPPFTCHTVIEPFIDCGYDLHTYDIDCHLNTSPEALERAIIDSKANVVLFHRYFGFDTCVGWENVIKKFSDRGVIFIEDRTQSLYSDFPLLSIDYAVGSLRKWAGLPDGGFALCMTGSFKNKTVEFDAELQKAKLAASFAKYAYMNGSADNKPEFLELYKKAEDILNEQKKIYAMSPASKSVQSWLDIENLKFKRRRNYKVLYDGLRDWAKVRILTPELSQNNVPLYLALKAEGRKDLQSFFCMNNIYAPIIWSLPDAMPEICEAAKEIYADILCIPIDQRYDTDDMERILDCIHAYFV